LVNAAELRWRIERDYQDLKQELRLGRYEGRGWRGFHHHATIYIAAHGFLISERGAIPASGQHDAVLAEEPGLPDGYRPRESPDPT
jgi:SRSO17 transposase